jgi:GT2 family glycosyltransferase
MTDPLGKVALAISTYHSDQAVLSLLRSVFAPGSPRYGAVVVVDSLGTGEIDLEAKRAGWDLHYINAPENLGSAGNLALRLKTCSELGMDWCYAVNHDGTADAATAEALLACAGKLERVGAVYPAVVYSKAAGRVEPPRRTLSPFSPRSRRDEPTLCEVAWGSSNSALYNLEPVGNGLSVWPELWMGWEDLAYGWLLATHGWRQFRCGDVEVRDDYEYSPMGFMGRKFYIADKPPWYIYYQLRNLLLIARRSRWQAISRPMIVARAVCDLLLTSVKRDRAQRISLLFRGLAAGFRGETGKGPVPS